MSKRYVNYDFYENGIEESVDGEKINQIIEEIIEIMRKNKITVGTARTILEDTISSITKRHSYHIECSNILRKK